MNEKEIEECIKSGGYSSAELLVIISHELPDIQRESLQGAARLIQSMQRQITRSLEEIVK